MDRLNEIMLQYVLKRNLYDISDYSSIYTMSKIILDSRVPNFGDKRKNRFGLTNSYKLAYEFFYSLDPKYASYFVDRANSGDIYLRYFKRNTENAYSFIGEDGRKKIYFPYGLDICDCFIIVHEMFHDMNLDLENSTVTRHLFTEYISFFGEFLFKDYIDKKYGIDFSISTKFSYNGFYIKAISVHFQIMLVKKFLDKGYLDDYDIARIINQYNPVYRNMLVSIFKQIYINGDLCLDFDNRYVIAVLLTCYTRDLIKEKKYDIDMFKFLNDNINYLFPLEVYSMLDLDVVCESTLDLSFNSYDKLKKSYCKYMR